MKKCNIPELPEKLYQENNGLGERLKVEERDWNVIFSKLFFRMIIFGLFALAFWGFVKNEKTIHWNRMFVIDGVVLMYAISPLRHFRDKIILYQFGVVYQGLIRKKEYLFSKWKPDQWSKGLGLRGIRCQLEGKKFALFPFDYTYVRSFREDFQLLYLNNIAYGEEEKKDRSVPMVSSPEAAINFMIENLAGEKGITSVYAYYQTSTRQSDIDSSYAIGISSNCMYVVPFVIGKNCFSYGRGYVYRKDAIGYIKRSNNSYTWQSYELQNKEKKTFFLFYVEAVSEKSFGLAPLALNQEQEAKAFLDTMTQWMSEVNC